MSYFGKNLRKIRNLKNLSQQAMAEVFELKRGTLGAYEEGRSEPKIDTLIKIANYFSISIDDLLTKELTVNDLLKFKGDLVHSALVQQTPMLQIPFVNTENEMEYLKAVNSFEIVQGLPFISLPLERSSGKIIRSYEVNNLEMSGGKCGLYPGDIVIGQVLSKSRYDMLETHSLVLLVSDHKMILRNLIKDGSAIYLQATDPNFEDIPVNDLSVFREIWKIEHVVIHHKVSGDSDVENRIRFIENELKKIKGSL